MKGEKHIAPMDFAEHLKKSYVSEDRKVYYGPFLQNGLHERYCYISESRWKSQYLENSTIHSLFLKRWRWNWPTENVAGVWSSMPIRLLRFCFIKIKFYFLVTISDYFFQKIYIIIAIWPAHYVLKLNLWNPHPFPKNHFY